MSLLKEASLCFLFTAQSMYSRTTDILAKHMETLQYDIRGSVVNTNILLHVLGACCTGFQFFQLERHYFSIHSAQKES